MGGAVGICPECVGETQEVPYSRFSVCENGHQTPTGEALEYRDWLERQPEVSSDCDTEYGHYTMIRATGECPWCGQEEVI